MPQVVNILIYKGREELEVRSSRASMNSVSILQERITYEAVHR